MVDEPPAVARSIVESIPLKRPASPEEVAAVALFLASEQASFITGTNIIVSGGMHRSVVY